MAISGVGGTPQGDPLQAQTAVAVGKWNQLFTKLKTLVYELKSIRGNLLKTPEDHLQLNIGNQIKGVINQIKTIKGELESLQQSGQLALALGGLSAADAMFKELNMRLVGAWDMLQDRLDEDLGIYGLNLTLLDSAIVTALSHLNEIVQ